MPTEVYDLSPQQLDWLYEHQALINGGSEPSFPTMTPSPVPGLIPDVNKNNYILDVVRRDSLMHGSDTSTDTSTANSTSHNSDGVDSQTEAEIIMFPFHLDRPSWEQSLTNMMCYKDRNGVRGQQ
jgi:hypothetical protein